MHAEKQGYLLIPKEQYTRQYAGEPLYDLRFNDFALSGCGSADLAACKRSALTQMRKRRCASLPLYMQPHYCIEYVSNLGRRKVLRHCALKVYNQGKGCTCSGEGAQKVNAHTYYYLSSPWLVCSECSRSDVSSRILDALSTKS